MGVEAEIRLSAESDQSNSRFTLIIPDILSAPPDPKYYHPPNLLALLGYVSDVKRLEDAKIKAGNIIPIEERIVSLAGGLPYPDRLTSLWKDYYTTAQAELLTRGVSANEILQYGGAAGNERMRIWAAKDAETLTGQPITPEDVITVPGLQYGISSAILKLCARENKALLTSTPTYSCVLDASEDPIPVPVFAVESDNQGMIPKSLDDTLNKLEAAGINPGLVYGMVIGNPDGSIMSDARGKQINEICKKYGIPFYVDYAYYKLKRPDNLLPVPQINYLDENIILGFTSSKLAAPGKRLAWEVIKSEQIRNKLIDTKRSQLILTAPDHELEFWQLAERSDFESQIENLVQAYDNGITTGLEAVNENSDIFQIDEDPAGGMFLYIRVPEGMSTYKYLGEILEKYKIAYSPGIWSQPFQKQLTKTGDIIGPVVKDNYMRLCVVTETLETVKRTINRLANIFREIAQREGRKLFSEKQVDSQVQIFPG